MILLYRLISILLYPFLVVLIFLRRLLNKEDNIRFKEKIFTSSFSNNFNDKKKIIWFHAASIGEVQSIFPIINELNNKKKIQFFNHYSNSILWKIC